MTPTAASAAVRPATMLLPLVVLLLLLLPADADPRTYSQTSGVIRCTGDIDCGTHGSCALPDSGAATMVCVCAPPYINIVDGDSQTPCEYVGVSRVNALVSSGLAGFLGADWFILSRGTNVNYIATGVAKLFTFGGFGFWWVYDFMRLASGAFTDGNGMPLFADM